MADNKPYKYKDYLTIKEFSEITGVSADALRNYDKKGIFKPAKYGEGLENNYRLYSPTQIITIKLITLLTETGVPLDTIKELVENRSPETMIKLFSKQKRMSEGEINRWQNGNSAMSIYWDMMVEGMSATENEIIAMEMPEIRIILGGRNDFHGSVGFTSEYVRFLLAEHEPKLTMSHPVGGYFESMDAFLDEPSQPTRFYSVDHTGNEKKEAGLYLVGYTRGYYGETNELPKRMAAFAKRNGLLLNGPVYNIHLFNEISVTDPNQYLLQVSASVKETRRVPSQRPTLR